VLTREQWAKAAELEAAKVHGRKHAGFYSVRHYAPVYVALFAVAALGYGAWWVWQQLAAHFASPDTATWPGTVSRAGVPLWTWVALALLVIGTAYAFRPGRIDRNGVLLAKVFGLGLVWLLLIGFTASTALG
jgi:hypothetical protein